MYVSIYHAAFEDTPILVATFEALPGMTIEQALNHCYVGTQNIDGNWVLDGGQLGHNVQPAVTVRRNARSTNVGDFAVITHADHEELQFFRCGAAGWFEIDSERAKAVREAAVLDAAEGGRAH